MPKDYKLGMLVHGIIYTTADMLELIAKDASIDQVANAAFLPGIVKASLAMPDIHQGYGPPIELLWQQMLTKMALSPRRRWL